MGLKATAIVAPQHWQPSNGLLMTNDVPENAEDVVPCVALSKNDSYVMSACGGKVSLFNMMNFKVEFDNPLRMLAYAWMCLCITIFSTVTDNFVMEVNTLWILMPLIM